MSDIQTTKTFQAKVPIAEWEHWERWLEGRAKLNNTQIFCGLLRLFFAAPESLQLKALFGQPKRLYVAETEPDSNELSPAECEEIREMFRKQLDLDARDHLAQFRQRITQARAGTIVLCEEERALVNDILAWRDPGESAGLGASQTE